MNDPSGKDAFQNLQPKLDIDIFICSRALLARAFEGRLGGGILGGILPHFAHLIELALEHRLLRLRNIAVCESFVFLQEVVAVGNTDRLASEPAV